MEMRGYGKRKIIEQKDSQVVGMRKKGRQEEDKNDIDGTLNHYVTSDS